MKILAFLKIWISIVFPVEIPTDRLTDCFPICKLIFVKQTNTSDTQQQQQQQQQQHRRAQSFIKDDDDDI